MLSPETWAMIGREMLNTLYMAGFSTLFGYVLGLPWGIVLAVTDSEGIRPNRAVYRVLDVITNIMRSIPFLILLILIIPFTRLLVGKSYGSTATIVPPSCAHAPKPRHASATPTAAETATDANSTADCAANLRFTRKSACGTDAIAPKTSPAETTRVIAVSSGIPKNAAIAGAAAKRTR